jgi:hypothetical protein
LELVVDVFDEDVIPHNEAFDFAVGLELIEAAAYGEFVVCTFVNDTREAHRAASVF